MLCNLFVFLNRRIKHRVDLVVKQYEKPTHHWTNQLVAWILPILSIVGMGIIQCSGVSIIGDCRRVW